MGTTETDFGAYCAPIPASSGHFVELEQQLAGLTARLPASPAPVTATEPLPDDGVADLYPLAGG